MASELYNTIDALSGKKELIRKLLVSAVEDAIVMATRKYYSRRKTCARNWTRKPARSVRSR